MGFDEHRIITGINANVFAVRFAPHRCCIHRYEEAQLKSERDE